MSSDSASLGVRVARGGGTWPLPPLVDSNASLATIAETAFFALMLLTCSATGAVVVCGT
jgi:hypothetical protein